MSKLLEVFKKFEYAGLLGGPDYSCCQNCGGCEVTNDAVERINAGRSKDSIKGCVFFTNQDTERALKTGQVYLAYGEMMSQEYDLIGSDMESAKIITKILDEEHIPYTWDENPRTRILAAFDPADFKEFETKLEDDED